MSKQASNTLTLRDEHQECFELDIDMDTLDLHVGDHIVLILDKWTCEAIVSFIQDKLDKGLIK